jgi:hypothetical protein
MQSDRQPPGLATWVLKRFGSSPNNQAVIGDLAERYQQGKSAAWYWRQVLAAIVISIFNDASSPGQLDFRAVIAGWIVFWTLFNALFPLFGRCPVLMCVAGFGSGLLAAARSRHWLSGLLLYTATVHLYWIGLGVTSSPYTPVVRLYKVIGLGIARSAQITIDGLVVNLAVLTLAIWFGGVCGRSPSTRLNERPSEN